MNIVLLNVIRLLWSDPCVTICCVFRLHEVGKDLPITCEVHGLRSKVCVRAKVLVYDLEGDLDVVNVVNDCLSVSHTVCFVS